MKVSEPAKELIRGLLERNIPDRTGSGPTDALELKQSKFLSTLNFDRVNAKAYDPEFKVRKYTIYILFFFYIHMSMRFDLIYIYS